MNITNLMLGFVFMLAIGLSAEAAGQYDEGKIYHGFKLIKKEFVKEVNAECYYFEHVKSGARLLKIAAQDQNKTFSIAFKTVPQSDAGTPHIMEHSVLNGSKNFPVKSPFDVLSKGSLHTFLNAMTGNDITIYPVASMNNKDYFNLMHVYLDAVFNPLLYTDSRILKQEGWHHEMASEDGPVVYKGVVYNEMKGAYSSPTRELDYQVYKNLFPDNNYKFSSGGYPSAIPTLTYDAFKKFHERFYHPANSYIYLYGDADLNKELAFIDSEYLSHYNKENVDSDIPVQKPFKEMKEVTGYYPVTEGSNTDNQTYLSLSFVAGLNTDRPLVMALDILADVLVNQESAPVRLALQKAGIGKEVSASTDNIEQNVFQITVQNANPADKEKFKEIITGTLLDVAKNGIDKKAVEGALNRMEFRMREGNDAQKGLTYNFAAITGWFFANDPFLSLEYEKPLAELKAGIDKNFLENTIKTYMVENQHKLFLTLEPKSGLEKENNAKIDEELKAYKTSLTQKDIEDLVTDTKELVNYQQREDNPEALEKIPMLSREDINPKANWYSVDEREISNVPVLSHDEFTNGVVYSKLYFDMRVLPTELVPYAALLAEVMGSLNTENYTYGDLDNELNINTGGFSTYLDNFLVGKNDENMIPKFVVSSKAMNDKVMKMFELVGEIVNKTKYADNDRLKELLQRHQSRLEANIKQNGYNYTQTRLTSYFSNQGEFNELTRGIEYYRFITELTKNFDTKAEEISNNLVKTANLLFNKNNLTATVTCTKNDYPDFAERVGGFITSLPENKMELKKWELNVAKKNEGFLTASKVQYVLKGFDYKKLGYNWSGKMLVLSQILSTDWLQTQIRVVGGAYGGWSTFTPGGVAFFASYRDPNLKETIANYDSTPGYLTKFEADDKEMTRYIIGTIAGLDRPLTPSEKGDVAVKYFIEKISPEYYQKTRDEVLATTAEDVRSMKKLVADVLAQNTFCIYGNEDKINSAKDIFGEVVNLNP